MVMRRADARGGTGVQHPSLKGRQLTSAFFHCPDPYDSETLSGRFACPKCVNQQSDAAASTIKDAVLATKLTMRILAEVDMSRPSVKSRAKNSGWAFPIPPRPRFPSVGLSARVASSESRLKQGGLSGMPTPRTESAPRSLACDSRMASSGSGRLLIVIARWQRFCVPGLAPL